MKRRKENDEIDLKSLAIDYAEDTSIFSDEDEKMHKMKVVLWHRLNEPDRRILLIYAETQSLRATAKIIGVSSGTIRNKINKIRERFERCLT